MKNQETTRLKVGEKIITNENIRGTIKRKYLTQMKAQTILMNIRETKSKDIK